MVCQRVIQRQEAVTGKYSTLCTHTNNAVTVTQEMFMSYLQCSIRCCILYASQVVGNKISPRQKNTL